MSQQLQQRFKELIGPKMMVWVRCILRGKRIPRWGNLRSVEPLSRHFGFDRGTPVDRFYLHRFLEKNRSYICGDVLEIQSTGYAKRYGNELGKVDSVDINPVHNSTFVCDLAQSEGIISSASYDCFLLPNTLQHLRDLKGSLKQALRIVKPGGAILASAACFLPLIPDGPDYWRFTAEGWREIAQSVWPGCQVIIESQGNCLTAVAAMLGLALEELKSEELDAYDPRYPVLITILCQKPGG